MSQNIRLSPSDAMQSFTIVTPVLNGWPRIRATVASVAAQRADADDCAFSVRHVVQLSTRSTDASREWLGKQARETASPSPFALREADDGGLYNAIALGFTPATTIASPFDILGWLNSDEQYLPGALDCVARVFAARPDIDAVFGDYLVLNAEGVPVSARRALPARLWYLRNATNYIFSCTTFFRRSLWDSLGGFNPAYRRVADKELYLRALARKARFLHIPAYLAAYTMTGHNASLDAAGLSEPLALRTQLGIPQSSVRRLLPRLCRNLEKALRGAYFPERVQTTLFDNEGAPFDFSGRLSPFWKWS